MDGPGKYFFVNGDIYEGSFNLGKKDGKWIHHYLDNGAENKQTNKQVDVEFWENGILKK